MTSLPDNILYLPEYQILKFKEEEHDLHFQVEAPKPISCEECGCLSLRRTSVSIYQPSVRTMVGEEWKLPSTT